MLEQKLIEAKENRRTLILKSVIAIATTSLVAAGILLFIAFYQSSSDDVEIVEPEKKAVEIQNIEASSTAEPVETVADEQLRQAYIDAVNNYQNTLQPDLNKTDLVKWDPARAEQLNELENEALSKFSVADYKGALDSIEKLTQLAQTMIADSQQAFETSIASAQSAYDVDNYEDADFHIKQALMLNKNSEEAAILANKIETLPRLLPLLEQAKTANVENKYEQELRLTKEIITLSPERKSAIERKQVLIELISNKNFKSAITQAYQAIKQGDADKAKQKLSAAKRIFPNRSEIVDATNALQQLERQQRFESHQQASQTAMAGDDWLAAKKQLDLALQEQPENEAIQSALRKTTTIIALQNEFDQHLTNPYRLANQQLATQTKAKLNEASKYSDISPSLNKKQLNFRHSSIK